MSSSAIIVGTVIEKDDKYLLAQEAKAGCRGQWNLPAGHLEPGETILEGTIRETKEETGCDVDLLNVCQIGNHVSNDGLFVSVIFTAKMLCENIHFDESETLDIIELYH